MKYTNEFKEQAFRVSRFSPVHIPLINALDKEKDHLVRMYLEDLVDDDELYEYSLLNDDGDRIVKNSKINAYNERVRLYSDFMEMFVTYLDELSGVKVEVNV